MIITGAGGSGVLPPDACVAERLSLMDINFRYFPFGAMTDMWSPAAHWS